MCVATTSQLSLLTFLFKVEWKTVLDIYENTTELPLFSFEPRFYLFILYNVMNYIVVLINVRYSSSIIGRVIVNSFGNSIQGESLLMIYQVEKHLRIVNIVSL